MSISESNNQSSNQFQVLSVLNGRHITRKAKSVTKSFRIDEDIIAKINEQANNNNTSLNAEINNILRKYVEWDMLASKVGMIPIISEIFQNILTKEQVIDLADKVAKSVIRDTAHFMKGNLDLASFLSWLKTKMGHSLTMNYTMENNSHQIIFKHDMGENWSIYHKIILDYILYEIGGYTVVTEATSTALLLRFS